MREEPIQVPAPPGWLVVTGTPAPEAVTAGLEGVLLLDAGESAAAALAGALGLPVVAPGGPVAVSPGGTLFAADGWWRHTPGGRRVPAGARWPAPAWQALIPDPAPWPLTARAIPAGWVLSTAPGPHDLADSVAVDPDRPRLVVDATVSGAALAAALRALPPAVRDTVDVVPLRPGQGAGRAVASAAAAELGEPVCLVNGVPLHTPSGSIAVYALDAGLRPVWAEPAGLLRCRPDGREEVLASAPPQPGLRAVGPATYALDLGWLVRVSGGGLHAMPTGPLPPARGRAALPTGETTPPPAAGRASVPTGDTTPPPATPPAAGRASVPTGDTAPPPTGASVSAASSVAGSAARPVGAAAEVVDYPMVADERYRVVVGTPGLDINDLVWPALSTLFTAALTDVPAVVELEVVGVATAWGRTAAEELAERHPGAGNPVAGLPANDDATEHGATEFVVATADGAGATPAVTHSPERPYARAEVLPLGGVTAELPLVPAARPEPQRRRRLALVGAAAAVLVAIGAGAVAAWPGRHDEVESTGFAGEQYTGPGLDPGATNAGPSAGESRATASVRPSRSGARATGSASASPAGPATAGTLGGQPSGGASQPLALDGLVNLAGGRATRDSGHTQAYGSGNVTDPDAMTYWESRNNAFPQWVQVDLGAPAEVRRAVLRLPPSASWPARTQRVEILGSGDDKTFTTLVGAATYAFDNGSGQRVTVTLPGTACRYVRLVFTANSAQPAGQLSALELYRG
ncbi:discoidin domain-containing protein [Dactylosporangium sp. CS-033363]|uniref:discoidin domain-containing protein n=1 Tax=Dactylosporangium sp. CS-033363 TaxID=3239935 RepID=UPI003D8A8008